MDTPSGRDARILILAPVGRDAVLAQETIGTAGIVAEVCGDVAEVCREAASGVGALLLTQEALSAAAVARLLEMLQAQPPGRICRSSCWSAVGRPRPRCCS